MTDNAQELASILTGLQDKWDISNFEELRLQGMIAVLVAQPLEMGQWFSATYFNGDYSISQRAAVLTTLGLGARELAGYGEEDAALTKSNQDASFPSKKLPPKNPRSLRFLRNGANHHRVHPARTVHPPAHGPQRRRRPLRPQRP